MPYNGFGQPRKLLLTVRLNYFIEVRSVSLLCTDISFRLQLLSDPHYCFYDVKHFYNNINVFIFLSDTVSTRIFVQMVPFFRAYVQSLDITLGKFTYIAMFVFVIMLNFSAHLS